MLVPKRGPGQPAAGGRQGRFKETLGEAAGAQIPFRTQAICLWFHPPKNSSLPQTADSSRVGVFFILFFFWFRTATKSRDCKVALMNTWVLILWVHFYHPTSIPVSPWLSPAGKESWIPSGSALLLTPRFSSTQVSVLWLLWASGCKTPRM